MNIRIKFKFFFIVFFRSYLHLNINELAEQEDEKEILPFV